MVARCAGCQYNAQAIIPGAQVMRKVMTEPLRGQFHELSDEECLELLRSKRLGRVAYDDEGPVVLPVDHVDDDTERGLEPYVRTAHSDVGQIPSRKEGTARTTSRDTSRGFHGDTSDAR